MELDRETLEKAAQGALERPSDAMFWDDRLFTTHGAVFHWAELSDDLLEESNYLTALAEIQGAAGDDADEHVIDGTSRHFAHGSLRTIYVQVYDDDVIRCRKCASAAAWAVSRKKHGRRRFLCGACKNDWDWDSKHYGLPALEPIAYRPRFTAAFIEATELALSLQDYPILDESDYSEREWEAFEKALKEAVEHAQSEYGLVDTCAEDNAIAELYYQNEDGEHRQNWRSPDDVDWEVVATEYREARDVYFLELATEVYRWNVLGYSPDQLALFAA
ncbi:hypothetical protein ABZ348_31110 [Streptomyces sp. NPDC005963]|uniref:hypothetical protein n=1 Tax=Streptomyces sp. NPDC005963 TaxID=3156721 RepID=UPI00340ED25C